jgi:hypothetical protein
MRTRQSAPQLRCPQSQLAQIVNILAQVGSPHRRTRSASSHCGLMVIFTTIREMPDERIMIRAFGADDVVGERRRENYVFR